MTMTIEQLTKKNNITKTSLRSHTCGELSRINVGSNVRIGGWVHQKRDHGGVFFIDLRDHYGIIQLVISRDDVDNGTISEQDYNSIIGVSNETVLLVSGVVRLRNAENFNHKIGTGEIEVIIKSCVIESEADQLPFQVNTDEASSEERCLEYRFLDLRRQKLHSNIMLRIEVINYIRNAMRDAGFFEFQTPILTASSPEGARDFLVPSRLHPGKFYALPQAPQQFKQLLMVSGFDRYFQIAPCFRDEDARADRAPGEFYQLDVEMSFVTQEDVFNFIEPVMHGLFNEFSTGEVSAAPFERITYADSMLWYGSDKPDLRNPIKICDTSRIFVDSDFSIFVRSISSGAVVRAIPAPNTEDKPRSFFDNMTEFAQKELGAKGLAYVSFDKNGVAKGPIAKFLTKEKHQELMEISGLNNGDSVFFVCDKPDVASKIAGCVRQKIGDELNLIVQNTYKLCWITEFPFYEWNPEEKRVDFSHNPFSMPQGGLEVLENADTNEKKLAIKAYQYDLVCNGIELSSGAIRNHKVEIMYKAFDIAGYKKEDVEKRFGGMIKAFKYGAPPHGGIAPGIDRIVMLLAKEHNIRRVIAFPLNQKAQDLLMQAPNYVNDQQLKDLHIQIKDYKDGNKKNNT